MPEVVLIVEDDARYLKLIRTLLRARGFPTLEAVDGERGVRALAERGIDLIVEDDARYLKLIRTLLRARKFPTLEAVDGERGVRALAERGIDGCTTQLRWK